MVLRLTAQSEFHAIAKDRDRGAFWLVAQAGLPVLLKCEHLIKVGFGLDPAPALVLGCLGASGMDGLTWRGAY